jgi:hypothetical protein
LHVERVRDSYDRPYREVLVPRLKTLEILDRYVEAFGKLFLGEPEGTSALCDAPTNPSNNAIRVQSHGRDRRTVGLPETPTFGVPFADVRGGRWFEPDPDPLRR